jgi:hypothetical protein
LVRDAIAATTLPEDATVLMGNLDAYLDLYSQWLLDVVGTPELPQPQLTIASELEDYADVHGYSDGFITYFAMPEVTKTQWTAKKAAGDSLTSQFAISGEAAQYLTDDLAWLAYRIAKKEYDDNLPPQAAEPAAMNTEVLDALSEYTEIYEVYNDNYQSLSTVKIDVGSTPIYPENYPMANIVPRYRKTFAETMYKTYMAVAETDINIRFRYEQTGDDSDLANVPRDFNMYFQYHQTVKE